MQCAVIYVCNDVEMSFFSSGYFVLRLFVVSCGVCEWSRIYDRILKPPKIEDATGSE